MRLFHACLAALLLCAAAPLRADQLADPAPIAVPADTTPADLNASIARALAAQGWTAESAEPGRMVAERDHLGSVARVRIAYDAQAVHIIYLDSTDLDYDDSGGERDISYLYNDWVQRLAAEIARFDPGSRPKPRIAQPNPPPAEKFSAFNEFELKPVGLDPRYNGGVNLKVQRKIDQLLGARLWPVFAAWMQKAPAGPRRALVVEPKIESVRYVGGAIRYMVGSMAGHSFIALRLSFTDAATGAVIANPGFYQEVGVDMATSGIDAGEDNRMLDDVVRLACNYTLQNYKAAVGGPSGDPTP